MRIHSVLSVKYECAQIKCWGCKGMLTHIPTRTNQQHELGDITDGMYDARRCISVIVL